MPNVFTSQGLEQLARASVAGLWESGVLVGTVHRDAEASFVVGRGDTVSIREPLARAASNFAGVATVSNIVEAKISIPIDQQPYDQVQLTAKEKTLLVENLASEVILPGTQGIVSYVDAAIAAKMATTTGAAGATIAQGWSQAAMNAREVLTRNGVPATDRWLACAPDVITGILNATVVTVGNLPDAGTALANGTVGRFAGFNVVESTDVPAGVAYAYHRTGVCAIFRTPVPPEGGAMVGSSSLRGLSAQVIYSYDNTKLSDVITQHTLFGIGVSDASFDKRVVKVTLA
jgi:hypothetical protein